MESLVVSLVAVSACVPLWWWGAPRGAVARAAAAAIVLCAFLVMIASFTVPDAEQLPRATRPLVEPEEGYVGSAACRSCHPAEHATWRESFHATMTQVASRATLVPKFEQLVLDWFGKPVQLFWRGDTLWVEFERAGQRPAPVRRHVEQLTGSHHFQVLWYSTGTGRELAPVPMCYKLAEGIWMPLTAVFVLPPEYRDPPEPGAWNQSCQMCHATRVQPRLDTDLCDTRATELGIACEACHGPGADHVAANKNPLRRYERYQQSAVDPTIVQPAALQKARSAEVCGQCHSVNILRRQHFDTWRDRGLVYRPGDDLHASNIVVDVADGSAPELQQTLRKNPGFFESAFWSDGEVRLTGREYNGLLLSPCHTRGDPAHRLDCTSCHELHRDDAHDRDAWRDDQLKPGMRGNVACTQCHAELAEPAALAAHTHHAEASSGSNCCNCHMPHTSFGLMKAARSHRISSPDVRVELATGRPNACNLCHLDRTLQWTNDHLQAFYGIAPTPLDQDQSDIAAAARWLLSGDAGQRALAAWSFGWADAQQASGVDWLTPFLARLLDDPYYAVRFGAARSLRSLPGGAAELAEYDFLLPAPLARVFGERVQARWQSEYSGNARPAVLLDSGGNVVPGFARLYARRDDRPVYLSE